MEQAAKSSISNRNHIVYPVLPDHLSPWIHSICIVTFDIEFGQAIESQYPKCKELTLTESEANNICYSSFPDSNSSIIGSTQFHFRMRLSNLDNHFKQFYSAYNAQTTQALNVNPQFIYGYVHFLQKKDSSLKRGYFQKSLVILSLLPFVELFYHIVSVIGTNYFENEQLLNLELIYNQAKKWPTTRIGTSLHLQIMGSSVAFYIPNKDDKLNSLHANISLVSSNSINSKLRSLKIRHKDLNRSNKLNNNSTTPNDVSCGFVATSLHGTPMTLENPLHCYQTVLTALDLDLYSCFYPVISDLQMLWEMILTCEPFIVMAQKPGICANFAQALTSLIYPFKYNADYRPFFTIHDPEFRDYVGLKKSKRSVILGVTNPFFAKSLEHWPNVIQLCSLPTSKSSDQISGLISSFSTIGTQNQQAHLLKIPFVDRLKFTSTEANKSVVNTKYRTFLQKDRIFLTKILRDNKAHGKNRPHSVQTALIRRWLIELTQSFFMPLERYLTQLMPLHSKISPFKVPPELPSFDIEAFLSTLETSGPHLTTKIKGDWLGLYRKFFACPNFHSWYAERKGDIDRKLWTLQLECFLDLDLKGMTQGKAEVEIVDMIIHLKRRLTQLATKANEYHIGCDVLDQFKLKLIELINTLPEDLRVYFLQNSQ